MLFLQRAQVVGGWLLGFTTPPAVTCELWLGRENFLGQTPLSALFYLEICVLCNTAIAPRSAAFYCNNPPTPGHSELTAHFRNLNITTQCLLLRRRLCPPLLGGKEFARYGKIRLAKQTQQASRERKAKQSNASLLNTEPNCKSSLYLTPSDCHSLSQKQTLLFFIPLRGRDISVLRKHRHQRCGGEK